MNEIDTLFQRQEEASTEFTKEMMRLISISSGITPQAAAKVNLRLAKTVFSKWSIEILTVLYGSRFASYGELKKALHGVSSRVLSEKLKRLEQGGLVSRSVVDSRPPRTQYSLTDDGVMVAKLGEPVFLFLGYKEGLYESSNSDSYPARP